MGRLGESDSLGYIVSSRPPHLPSETSQEEGWRGRIVEVSSAAFLIRLRSLSWHLHVHRVAIPIGTLDCWHCAVWTLSH